MIQQTTKISQNQPDASNVALVGRQTIYKPNLTIFGYELLYRPSGKLNAATGDFDGSLATGEVMLNTFMEMGLTSLVSDKYAFINLTREYVEGEMPIAFSSESIVLEILEDIVPTDTVIKGIKSLKERGFIIALDDFVFDDRLMSLVPLADIIKVDIMGMPSDILGGGIEKLQNIYSGKLLAEKVETQSEFDMCKELGFDYFQGYFLEKPVIIKGQKMPSNKVAILHLLSRLQDSQVEFEELEEIIKNDPSLSFKLLRYINSPSFNLGTEISSIKQALVLLGLATLKRWMTLIIITGASDKSLDLILKALCRAHMCEKLAKILKVDKQDQYFLVGLFSILDAMLDLDKSEILKQIPIHEELKLALLEEKGNMGKVLKCVMAYEHANWKDVRCGKIPLKTIQRIYLESIAWANDQVSAIN